MKSQALAASTLVALGVATGSLLAPQAASALDFTFSFGGVSGLIENLVEGQNTCDGTTSCVVKVTNNGGTGAGVGRYEYLVGVGFVVTSGVMSFADWIGRVDEGNVMGFSTWIATPVDEIVGFLDGKFARTSFAAVQPPASSVPGPLPLFGAAAAFGFSRKLRSRIKVTRTTAPTRPAG